MKSKNIISLTIAFIIVCLGTTGLLLYFGLKPQAVTAIHVLFGLLFIGFIIFHIKNNWSSLKVYTKERKSSIIHKEFYLAAGIAIVVLTGAGFNLPPFGQLVHAGEALTRGEGDDRRGRFDKMMFTEISTNKEVTGSSLNFLIQKKQGVAAPIIIMWLEDTAHRFIQNLFVPSGVDVVNEEEKDISRAMAEGEVTIEKLQPAVFPRWQSTTKDTAANYTGATPADNFFLATKTAATGKYHVVIEIKNKDTNEIYEALVDAAKGDVFSLKSKNNTLLQRALVEVK